MSKSQVQKLHAGDQVRWNDPDEGICSRTITIKEISINGDVVIVTDTDGITLECFASELS